MSYVIGRDSTHTARKRHQCIYCLTAISPGERYCRRVGVDGGDFWSMEFHPECDAKAVAEWKWDEWEDRDWSEPQFRRPMTAFDPCI